MSNIKRPQNSMTSPKLLPSSPRFLNQSQAVPKFTPNPNPTFPTKILSPRISSFSRKNQHNKGDKELSNKTDNFMNMKQIYDGLSSLTETDKISFLDKIHSKTFTEDNVSEITPEIASENTISVEQLYPTDPILINSLLNPPSTYHCIPDDYLNLSYEIVEDNYIPKVYEEVSAERQSSLAWGPTMDDFRDTYIRNIDLIFADRPTTRRVKKGLFDPDPELEPDSDLIDNL